MSLPVVLIVDDDPLQLALFEAMLLHLSCVIITANSGKQTLQLLNEAHPEVIILDVVMAEMDGLQVLHSIRTNEQFGSLRIILLSVLSDSVAPADARLCNKVLVKPVNQDLLLQTVQACLFP